MTESMRVGLYSLRFKFALVCIVVEIFVLAAMVWNSDRIAENSLHEVFQARVQALIPLLNLSLTNPLLQRDYATLDERLARIVQPDSMAYIEVRDELNQLVAKRGDVPQTSRLDTIFDTADGIYDQIFDITLAGRVIGRARYGLNISVLQATQNKQRVQGVALALTVITLTFLLLATLAHLLTRRLRSLAHAAQAIQSGDYSVRVAEGGRDEVAVVSHAFNAMAKTVERDIVGRERAATALRQSEYYFRTIFEQATDGILIADAEGHFQDANSATCQMLGYSREDLLKLSIPDILAADELPRIASEIGRLNGGNVARSEWNARRKDGSPLLLEVTSKQLLDGRLQGFLRDITERKRAEEALRQSESRYRLLVQNSPYCIHEIDTDGRFISMNQVGLKLMRVQDEAEIFGRHYLSAVAECDKVRIGQLLDLALQGQPAEFEFGSVNNLKFQSSFVPIMDEKRVVQRLMGLTQDVTERKRAEAEIEYLAYNDALTNLPNRAALQLRLGQAVQQAQSHSRTMALLLMDLNNFREINDTLGHQNGDKVLVQVAERLRRTLWASDIVARLGGDEFAVLLPQLADKEHVSLVVAKILAAMRQPLMIADVPLDVQTAIGIALFPDNGRNADTLLQHADVALYAAKEMNLTHLLYNSTFDHYNPQQLALMGELRLALQREELTLHYQPVVDIKSGKTVGVEALVRWQHPGRGLLYPDTFIPAAEKTGLIASLTTWVLANALRQQHRWHRAGIDLNVSVNLSVRNLQQHDIVDEVRDMLLSSGVSPEKLTIEITESAIMVDPDRAKAVLTELHNLGIRFAIDDFGIGHSSLAYLKHLPVDKMKVDKSFVMDFKNPANAAIVRATIDLAHNLGLSVTAEGVEDESALNALGLLGCDQAQGYFLSRPQAVDKLGAWLRESTWGLAEKDA